MGGFNLEFESRQIEGIKKLIGMPIIKILGNKRSILVNYGQFKKQ
jgi:hypothetical protein